MEYQQRIRNIREDRDLKQQDIAKILEIDKSNYGKYERAETEMPVRHIITLCKYYNLSADYILGLTDEEQPLQKANRSPQEARKEMKAKIIAEQITRLLDTLDNV